MRFPAWGPGRRLLLPASQTGAGLQSGPQVPLLPPVGGGGDVHWSVGGAWRRFSEIDGGIVTLPMSGDNLSL